VSLSAGGFYGPYSASFTASNQYKTKSKKMTNSKTVEMSATASCNIYKYSLNKYHLPCLSNSVMQQIDKVMKNPKKIFEFIFDFGTHAIMEVNIGSMFIATTSIDA